MCSKLSVQVRAAAALLAATSVSSSAIAQTRASDRLSQPIRGESAVALRGNIHPRVETGSDLGPVDSGMAMERVTLSLKLTQAQQQALDDLLQQQQDPSSPKHHRWLTPEEYADQFGLSKNDVDKVTAWLTSRGFKVVQAARGRNWVAFNGTSAQVASAFRTSIHHYEVDGKSHYANASEPSVPGALATVVQGIRSLNNFHPHPRATIRKMVNSKFTSSISGNHFLTPDDFAMIYSLQSLYDSGIDGTGQKIAVVGQTNIKLSDIQTFRSVSGLPANDPQLVLVPGSSDPGIVSDDIGEANLDLEWSGAVARKATLIYVYSKNGTFDALQYAVDQNIAPVISVSYGACEAEFSSSDVAWLTALGKQANAQGQTIAAASGDSGAADCDYSASASTTVTSAKHGLAVDLPAALPYVTGVGGTRLSEGIGSYWNTTNNRNNGSALAYIPEIAWNDTADAGELSGSGGGKSTLFTKPSWQTGTGVPSDGVRDVPDVSFPASAEHDGYLVCSEGSCVNGYRASDSTLTVYGGTSAGAPTFAGLVALISQKMGAAQGNVNPTLYSLATSASYAFQDVVSGDNKVPCTVGTTDCASGGSIGYSADVGYDLATGLGSVHAQNLVSAWADSSGTTTPDFAMTAASSTMTVASDASASEVITVSALNGFTGTVSLTCAVPSALSGVTCSLNPSSIASQGTATLTVSASTTSARSNRAPLPFGLEPVGLCVGAVLLIRRRKFAYRSSPAKRGVQLCTALIVATVIAVGCGGGGTSSASNTVTTTRTGTITVTGISGTTTRTAQIEITAK